MGGEAKERWQLNIKSLKEGICHLYDSKDFWDVTFQVRGQSFKCHRLVLASRSSELARILLSRNAPDEIIVDDGSPVTKPGFEILLRFIYKDELVTTDKKSIVEGYLAAKYYRQRALEVKCEDVIKSWVINIDEVCDLLDVATDAPALKDKCITFVRNNAMAVVSSSSFAKASFKTLSVIMESGALENVPAVLVINYVMKWGEHRHTSPCDYSLVRKKLLDANPTLLGMLRFETLSLDELATIVEKYPGLLTANEGMNFMIYNASKKASVLPKWCLKAK